MNEALVAGLLCATVGAVAGKIVSVLMARRSSGGQSYRNLAAHREMVDVTSAVDDLVSRMSGLEGEIASIKRMNRRDGRGD